MFEGLLIVIGLILGTALGIYISYKILFNKNNPQKTFEEQTKLISDIREAITNYILTTDVVLFNAIAKQKTILNDHNRIAIAIFLSASQFKDLLTAVLGSSEHTDDVYNSLKELNIPIGFMGDLPIYVSELLTEAPVFVAGGIQWTMDA